MKLLNNLLRNKKSYSILHNNPEYINLGTIQNYNIESKNNENLYGFKKDLYDELITYISNYVQCNKDNILLTSGSGAGLQLILKTFCNDNTNILIPVPNYNGFIHDAHLTSHNVKEIYFDNSESLDVENYEIIYISTPNIPLGYEIEYNKYMDIIQKNSDKLFIIDEAYFEYGNNQKSFVNTELENLILVRTFSKAFALAGIRLGYLVTHRKTLDKLKIAYCSKSITNYAIEYGVKVFNNLDKYLNQVKLDKEMWNRFITKANKYINSNKIITDILYISGPFFVIKSKDCDYIVNIFKKYKILIKYEIKFNLIRIQLATQELLNLVLKMIKKINGYSSYDIYYIDIDITIRNTYNDKPIEEIDYIINTLGKTKEINFITNNPDNYNIIKTYLQDNNIRFNKLYTPYKSILTTKEEEYNGWFMRNNKLYITKFPLISYELYNYIELYKEINIIEYEEYEITTELGYPKNIKYFPYIGKFIQLVKQDYPDIKYNILGKSQLKIEENNEKDIIMIGDSHNDFKFAKLNNYFYYKVNNNKETLNFLKHELLLELYTPINVINELYLLFNKLVYILNKIGIKWWLDSGTLLGAIRYNKLIPWDDDIDIGILKIEDHLLISNIQLFKKHNLRLQKNRTNAYWQIDTLFDKIGPIHDTIHIDIFMYENIDNKLYNTDERFKFPDNDGNCSIVYTNNDIFPLHKLEFNNVLLPVPRNYIKLIENAIGKDYKEHIIVKKDGNKILEIKKLDINYID